MHFPMGGHLDKTSCHYTILVTAQYHMGEYYNILSGVFALMKNKFYLGIYCTHLLNFSAEYTHWQVILANQ